MMASITMTVEQTERYDAGDVTAMEEIRALVPHAEGGATVEVYTADGIVADAIETTLTTGYALRHLAGIDGGLAGAARDLGAGADIAKAAGLGDSWDLPEGVSQEAVEGEVCRIVEATR
jgi:hypothetical protein